MIILSLTQFTGSRLDAFLTMLDLLLPFPQDSRLGLREIKHGESSSTTVAGPAHYAARKRVDLAMD